MMTTFPKAKARPDNTPTWLKAARSYYGDAFETNKKEKLAESMADWCEMDADERGFVLAHMQYLNLLAQRGTQRLLLELRAMLEEVGDELIEVVEAAAEDLGDEGEDPALDEDDDGEGAEIIDLQPPAPVEVEPVTPSAEPVVDIDGEEPVEDALPVEPA